MSYKIPKYPRVCVSLARHKKLHLEANKKGVSVEKLAEKKFKSAK